MGIATVHVFKARPGKDLELMALAEEGRQLLQERGLMAATLTPIFGSEVGGVATVVNYDDNRAHVDAIKKIEADQGWQEFWVRASGSAAGELDEVSLYTDTDPAFAIPSDRQLGALQYTQWSPRQGRLMGLIENIGQARPHLERLGGAVRVLNCMAGKYPMTLTVSVGFEDLDHYAEYADKFAVDEQFQAYWAGVMADPTATLIRSGLFRVTA
jgi:hypothetical protein